MIVRKTYPELTENHINPMCGLLRCYSSDRRDRLAHYNDSKKNIVFPNGSRILFRYCDTEKDAERFQGTEVDILFIDEATHQSEERFKKLTACVRGVNEFPKRIYLSCNPGGIGHGWVKRLFIDKAYTEGERQEDYVFIKSLVTDNKALMESDPDYIRQLEALPPKLREAWLLGDWDSFSGQVFGEWVNDPDRYHDRYNTHVIQPFYIPREWQVLCSMDWGYTRPFSIGWYTFDGEGRMYRIREYYGWDGVPNNGVRLEPSAVAKKMHEIEESDPNLKGRRIIRVGDPAIWGKQGGESIGELFEKEGISFDKAKHDRINGKMQCHHRLAFGDDGKPMFYCFSTCRNFIRTIPNLVYDESDVEDVDTDGEDHIYDEWRYACMEHQIAPRKNIRQRVEVYDPLSTEDIKYDPYAWYRVN